MKIAIVYDVAYPFRMGGGEKRNWEIARRLAARGHDVWLLSMQMWDGAPELVKDGVRQVGICPWKYGAFKADRRSLGEPFYFTRHLLRFLKKNSFDVIDCAGFPYLPCFAARLAGRSNKAAVVITWYEVRGFRRWFEHRGLIGLVAGLLERMVAGLKVQHVAISEFTARRGAEVLGMKSMRVVPCGVESGAVLAERSEKSDQILYVGRLVRFKRVDMLIRVFAELAGEFPTYILKIVGKGDAQGALEQLANNLGISGKVVFSSMLDESELAKEYASSRVFVLPSEQEGFGIVLLEAMAAGTPVVALRAAHSAASDLIKDLENGMLVADESEMLAAIKALLADGPMAGRMAAAGFDTARKYDWGAAVVQSLEKTYVCATGGADL